MYYRFGIGIIACMAITGAARRVEANIIYDVPNGITAQPSDDIRWNSTGAFGVGAGVVIAPNYFLSAQHLGGSSVFSLTTTVNNVTTTNTYNTAGSYDVPNTDLRVWKIAGTFPSASIVPLYSGPAGSEVGQSAAFLGMGHYQQGSILSSTYNGGTVQNGWIWGANAAKNFGQNTIDRISNDAPHSAPSLDDQFKPVTGQNESIFTVGDSGGGTFIYNTAAGRYELAGINYGLTQYYTQPNAASAVNAAVYDSRGLYVSDGVSFYPADTVSNGQYLHQNGYASEIAPYEALIDSAIGAPEPGSLCLGVASMGLLLLRRQRWAAAGN